MLVEDIERQLVRPPVLVRRAAASSVCVARYRALAVFTHSIRSFRCVKCLSQSVVGARRCTRDLWPALARAGLLAAAGAATAEMNVVVLNLEFSQVDLGPRELVEARVFHVDDCAAIQTDEVVVLVELGVEPGGRAGVAGLGEEAEGDECPQDAMDRHPGDLGESWKHRPVNLFGGGVVGTVEDGLEHGAALGGDRQAALAMGGEEAVDPLLFFRRPHVSEMEICTR